MSAFVNDTFTGTNGTLIAAHVGEVGATWTREATAADVNWQIESNTLQRQDFAGSYSASYIHASGVPPGTSYYVEIGLTLNANATFFEMALLARGYTVPDNGFGQAVEDGIEAYILFGGSDTQLKGRWSGGGGAITSISPSVGSHVLRLEVRGTLAELFWDGVSKGSKTVTGITAQTPSGFVAAGYAALALSSSNFSTPGDASIDYFTADTLAPPDPFWTDYVKTTEATA